MRLSKKIVWYGLALLTAMVIGFQYVKTQLPVTSAAKDNVKMISSDQEFKTILDNAGSKMLVVDLYADWCAPCRIIQPTISKLADKYQGKVEFYKVNIDVHPQIAAVFKTKVLPYVVFVKDQKVITSFAGVNSLDMYEKVIAACAVSTESCERAVKNL